jgi:alkanesulfonate monooxygenase SsuD/methylene tetrahydromethanopterin reductase-like flavin-dependent oxidoreductase (luciferase family)
MAFTLGFHTRIPFRTSGAGRALWEGVELFQAAERLGYDRGWVYQRHFDNYLSSPLVFLPVVAQHTERIGVGSAIIGIRYQDPILLAEQAATADHLSHGRLQLGLGKGMGAFDVAFGQLASDGGAVSKVRLDRFLRAITDQVIGEANGPFAGVEPGEPLTVRGVDPSLIERTWFGAGSIGSAERVAGQGLALMMSTVLTGAGVSDFNSYQAEAITRYRATHIGARPPRVAISRSILPATSSETARLYGAYDQERRSQGTAASRPSGAMAQDPNRAMGPPGHTVTLSVSPAVVGEPAHVVETLLADPAVRIADELICFLPPAFDHSQNLRLITDIAETVAPQLGWSPAAVSRSLQVA